MTVIIDGLEVRLDCQGRVVSPKYDITTDNFRLIDGVLSNNTEQYLQYLMFIWAYTSHVIDQNIQIWYITLMRCLKW